MRAKWLFLIIIAMFIAGIVLAMLVIETKVDNHVDIIAANKMLKTIESHWGHIEQRDYSTINQQFAVLDNSGIVLYQTAEELSTTINDAIRNRDTIIDVMQKDSLVGKLIIHNDNKEVVQHMKSQLLIIIVLTFTTLMVLCVLYIIFLNHTVFTPFKKLQSFAVNVARGNLDIPLTMDKDNPFGAFTESFDIMREELATARHSEYVANRSKKELVASLSHDIKTPVASIKAVSELMLMRATEDKVIKQLNTIYMKAEQINLLVTDMFHATLEELQELKVTVMEELSEVLNGIIANVNYDDQISWDPIPECIILTDVTRLQQVFDNILSNSYKYAGTVVTITSLVTHTHLELRIMDYGSGINGDELPLVFNKFYRGNNAEGKSGSGLGLFISKYLMQNMQSDIECHNRGDGLTVTLRIKLA
ncbi:HAMP domain-containing sensor histidine kinase [Paenibacillus macquariensis]|uniref:histidine kinase n=1 Tax=Paenibacillus macquariensis TaxID=948756 RepID=A0ABY1K5Q0_9BACL|nr:HAMP domain-containing sensor histidine kinase [Paenibacillus macquariensis]MEC0090491.1 HAMP domain-containing sensor histidine kinase [Paenibacillus macquariensis]OAB38493.1 two-component sensor histidine kinase [Paenibacillus macquariensis subsp. macquariensis]SIR30084.1 Signal transduction histidine kinase [Paenibacillus macquariensis]